MHFMMSTMALSESATDREAMPKLTQSIADTYRDAKQSVQRTFLQRTASRLRRTDNARFVGTHPYTEVSESDA